MATLQATKLPAGATEQMPGIGDGQGVKAVSSTYTWASAPALNDVIQGALIQRGSLILDVIVVHSGLGTSGTFKVGYGGDDDYFVTSASQATAAVVRKSAATAQPLLLDVNDTVDVTITAAGASGTGTITITVFFLPVYSA